MKLIDIADISLGTILTRVKPQNELDDCLEIDTITMQELSYVSGYSDVEWSMLLSKISKKKINKCLLTRENDIVIGLSSQNSMVITKERANKLLLSNFCLVRIKNHELLDPYYFVWLINECKSLNKQLTGFMQGSAYVKMFSLDTIRNLEIDLPAIDVQRKIGKIYSLGIEKDRISKRIIELNKISRNTLIEKKVYGGK